MDFDSTKSEGGVAALERMVKTFAAAGISHKTIALFDNDAAGSSSYQALQRVTLPSNIKPLLLPPLALAQDYPTIGPQGSTNADVNGKACSIEMYLGKHVLCNSDRSYIPILWSNYQGNIREYQGAIRDKDKSLKRFNERMDAIESGQLALSAHDWSGLQAIFHMIFREASTL
jgi:hypothetical protein